MGGATKWTPVLSPAYTFQSTLPVGGSDCSIGRLSRYSLSFQIHAPRRGSDLLISETPSPLHNFNPRSPQGERQCRYADFNAIRYFNPRSPQGERLPVTVHLCRLIAISIHAPRRGSDIFANSLIDISRIFQSTLPAGGATMEEVRTTLWKKYFNPRSPQGERLTNTDMTISIVQFQSTLPAGGATISQENTYLPTIFQSTLPAGGATRT